MNKEIKSNKKGETSSSEIDEGGLFSLVPIQKINEKVSNELVLIRKSSSLLSGKCKVETLL